MPLFSCGLSPVPERAGQKLPSLHPSSWGGGSVEVVSDQSCGQEKRLRLATVPAAPGTRAERSQLI